MYQYNRKKEIIKNVIYIVFILLLAVIPTYYIYNKFQEDRDISVNSTSLDVTYHENTGDRITLTKITPVTDSVGLSSKAYTITIKNNLTEKVAYKVKLVDDLEKIADDLCEDKLLSKDVMKVSIKTSKMGNKIYNLSELEDDIFGQSNLNKENNLENDIFNSDKNNININNNGNIKNIEIDNNNNWESNENVEDIFQKPITSTPPNIQNNNLKNLNLCLQNQSQSQK